MNYEDECEFVGPEVCEENLDEKGLNRSEEEREYFKESDEYIF